MDREKKKKKGKGTLLPRPYDVAGPPPPLPGAQKGYQISLTGDLDGYTLLGAKPSYWAQLMSLGVDDVFIVSALTEKLRGRHPAWPPLDIYPEDLSSLSPLPHPTHVSSFAIFGFPFFAYFSVFGIETFVRLEVWEYSPHGSHKLVGSHEDWFEKLLVRAFRRF